MPWVGRQVSKLSLHGEFHIHRIVSYHICYVVVFRGGVKQHLLFLPKESNKSCNI